ncbi:phage holin family protein [Leucobacter allii]|uniref:Phage holin family protein n=1 Tax=Leucobacter allii TaxID=2932247 RepID=A0ABY4FNG2_9MICO|nr:phage holin family protein [Leucobacter allii]UOQ57823.1 phage holin family protein [Leucobacter allii]
MIRFLCHILIQLVLGAIALIVIHVALPDVGLSLSGFFIALGVFTLAHAVLGPFVLSVAQRYAASLAGGVGLVATCLSLWIATWAPGGLKLHGLPTWLLAPVIVWLITALGGWIFMGLIIDRRLMRRKAYKLARSIA